MGLQCKLDITVPGLEGNQVWSEDLESRRNRLGGFWGLYASDAGVSDAAALGG